jgi:sulfite reductase alpha subunit-like flavoprotein
MRCTSTSSDHEGRSSKYCSTSDTSRCRRSTSSTCSHSRGPESSPSRVPSRCAHHPSPHSAASLTSRPKQKHPQSVQLCIAIVKYKTNLKHTRKGLCTTWLAGLEPSTDKKYRVGIHRGLLTLPPTPQTPLVCIGPGTGIAPMRCMIQERTVDGALGAFLYFTYCIMAGAAETPEDNTLYFGCRSEAKDYYYSDEWEKDAQDGKLVFRVAFSRDQVRQAIPDSQTAG